MGEDPEGGLEQLDPNPYGKCFPGDPHVKPREDNSPSTGLGEVRYRCPRQHSRGHAQWLVLALLAHPMPTRAQSSTLPETKPATPDTLLDAASRADLGKIDEKTALMIKYCQLVAEAKFAAEIAALQSRVAALEEKHLGTLRELRDKLDAIRFDDVLKVLIGIFGGFLVRAFSDKGLNALQDTWVDASSLGLVLSLVFLILRYVSPSARKREITADLQRLQGKAT